MKPETDWRPDAKLHDLLTGKVAWDDADEAIRSWARLTIYQAADKICERPNRKDRIAMLGKIPTSIRPHVEAEVIRLWNLRKNNR